MGNAADDDAHVLHDMPIGLTAAGLRREFDSMGEVEVPADRYWGLRPSDPSSTSPSEGTGCRRRSTTPMAMLRRPAPW